MQTEISLNSLVNDLPFFVTSCIEAGMHLCEKLGTGMNPLEPASMVVYKCGLVAVRSAAH